MTSLSDFGTSMSKLLAIARRPDTALLILRDVTGMHRRVRKAEVHLAAAVDWLCRAHDASEDGGVSAGFYPLHEGWLPSYPETTGYIIRTFLELAREPRWEHLEDRALRMGRWECKVQLSSGAVRAGVGLHESPRVFNTGQVILGWLALAERNDDSRFLDSAIRAGNWLVTVQGDDGRWDQHSHHGIAHAYHSRVAWSLLELYRLTGHRDFKNAAHANLRWVLNHHSTNGFIRYMGFEPDQRPLTHLIGYTLRGLLESSQYLEEPFDSEVLEIAATASQQLLLSFERRKKAPDLPPLTFPAVYDEHWSPAATYSCLTGSCQVALVWLRLFQTQGDPRFLNAALKLLDQVKSSQPLKHPNPSVRGAIPGSFPCWGDYNPLAFPNWAAKFFVDAIVLQDSIMSTLERQIS